ncbi:membrane protein [Salmonella enterica subsp. arizonae]|nr:membrane protein [Salmonella enterica subsp. arizonae]
MDINTLITHYGYAALVIGSMAEGETVTLLGGVAAHQGLLKFRWWRRPSRWEG